MSLRRKQTRSSKKIHNLDFEIQFFEGLIKRDPHYIEALRILGDAYTKKGLYEKGLEIDTLLAQLCPHDGTVMYNLACSLALIGKIDEAFATLEKAISNGYTDLKWMNRDRDLESLRNDPRFGKIRQKLSQARTTSSPENEQPS